MAGIGGRRAMCSRDEARRGGKEVLRHHAWSTYGLWYRMHGAASERSCFCRSRCICRYNESSQAAALYIDDALATVDQMSVALWTEIFTGLDNAGVLRRMPLPQAEQPGNNGCLHDDGQEQGEKVACKSLRTSSRGSTNDLLYTRDASQDTIDWSATARVNVRSLSRFRETFRRAHVEMDLAIKNGWRS